MDCVLYVALTTDNEVLYQQEKLPFTCSPIGDALTGTIADISLWKNSTSGWIQIVRIWIAADENDVFQTNIKWTYSDIESRVNVTKKLVHPSRNAGLQIEIIKSKVKCSDSGVYKCVINGNLRDGIGSFNGNSTLKTVGMKGKQKL